MAGRSSFARPAPTVTRTFRRNWRLLRARNFPIRCIATASPPDVSTFRAGSKTRFTPFENCTGNRVTALRFLVLRERSGLDGARRGAVAGPAAKNRVTIRGALADNGNITDHGCVQPSDPGVAGTAFTPFFANPHS